MFQRINRNPVKAKVRADYPAIGSGSAYSGPRITAKIIHDAKLWDSFTNHANRYNAVPGKAATQPVTRETSPQATRTPSRTRMMSAKQREEKLLSKMNEAHASIFKEDPEGHGSLETGTSHQTMPKGLFSQKQMQLTREERCII